MLCRQSGRGKPSSIKIFNCLEKYLLTILTSFNIIMRYFFHEKFDQRGIFPQVIFPGFPNVGKSWAGKNASKK